MKKAQFQFALPVSILREGDSFIAYTPALDLSTVGDTLEQAQKRFEEAVQLFFEEITEKGTVNEALAELGWQKADNQLTPPVVISHQTETFSVPQFAL
ncbi:MAG TPA: hypothetical protein VMR77_00395 [Patescibacteria group bacterium]|jgi:predicted RNase H-like HicB family nuclease|nr:hypothetical protein [Patescibacteria group bacterium]